MALTIEQISRMEAATHSSGIPSDISALLSANYFSESRQEQVAIKDLTLPHFIRVIRSGRNIDCSTS